MTAAQFSDALVRLASPLVPGDIRRDWMREWRAELAYRDLRARRAGRSASTRSLWYAAGALPHAIWLRWDRWRIEMLAQDMKYAIRSLLKKPGFTMVTVLTLAIGIGANAAIFGAVNAVLLRPLPFPDPDRLVQIFKTSIAQPDRIGGTVSPPDFTDWRRDATRFTDMAAVVENSYPLTGRGAAEQVPGAQVTGAFFEVLGVGAQLGRVISTADDAMGGRDVVILSHTLWTRRFGAASEIVGQQIQVDGVFREVIGVMPAGFAYPLESELWVPLRFSPRDLETQRGAHYISVIGRLKPEAAIESARAEMRAIATGLAQAFPTTNRDSSASVHRLRDALVGSVRQSLFVLLGAVGLVLLIVCVNVASLVLVRAVGRGREMAVRVAVGAGRFSLFRGLLVESVVLGLAGGAVGLVLAYWSTSLIASMDASVGIPMLNQTRLDVPVVAFTFAISVAAAILFGTMPAWYATGLTNIVTRIREEGGSTTGDPKRQRLRSVLIVAETTLAVVLLVGAGLLTRSFAQLLAVDLGFTPASVQTFTVTLPETRYVTPLQRAEFVDSLITRVAARPDVEAAGAVFGLPLTNFRYGISTSTVDGIRLSDDDQDRLTLQVRIVTPDYLKAMRIPIRRGRGFTTGDRLNSTLVVLLNEMAAERVWPGQEALGHRLELGTRMGQGGVNAGGMVVGIVADVHDQGPSIRAAPTIYLAHAQFPVDFMTVAVRGRGEAATLIEPLRTALQELDPDVPMFRVRSMEQIAANAVAQPRLYMALIVCFAATALLLAAIGLYAVLAYAVGQRTREIGIRLALGADRGEVLRMVIGQAGRLAAAGVVAGLAAALLATRALQSQLFEVTSTDGATYALVAAGLFVVSMLASWIPARRAARTDPITALRHD